MKTATPFPVQTQQMEFFLEMAPGLLLVVKPTGEVVAAGGQMKEQFALCGVDLQCVAQAPGFLEALGRLLEEEGEVRFETRQALGGEHTADFLWTGRYDEGSGLAYCFGRDVSEQKRRQEAIDRDQKQKIHSSKMMILGEMAGSVAHEINNPIAIIQGSAFQIQAELKKATPDLNRLGQVADRIIRTTQRVSRIVKGLRSIARDGSGDPFQVVAAKTLIEDTLEFCSYNFSHRSVDLRVVDFPETISFQCREVQISQVLLNLLKNALDAVEKVPNPWVEIAVTAGEEQVQIAITDAGLGIPEPVAQKIMNPFFTTKEVGRGTGLGLSISQGIVREHGGSLALDRAHSNTRFVLTLPVSQLGSLKLAA